MTKDKRVELRISEETASTIKEFGGKFSEIFDLGYDLWVEKIPSLLQQRVEYHRNKLKECTEKTVQCTEKTVQRNNDFEQIRTIYVQQGRSVDDPSGQDLSWIKGRCQSKKISYERFLMYLKEVKP